MLYLQLLAMCFGSTADLSNYRYSVRERGTQRLIAELPRSFPAVAVGCYDRDAEVRDRCMRIIRERCPVIWQAWSAPTIKIGVLLLCDREPPPQVFLDTFSRTDCNRLHVHGIQSGVMRFDDDCEWLDNSAMAGYALRFACKMKAAREGREFDSHCPDWKMQKPLTINANWLYPDLWRQMP